MSEILQKWLLDRLGIFCDLTPENFGSIIQDGRIIAHLLHCYGLITNEQVQIIIPTNNPIIYKENLKNIQKWLKKFQFSSDSVFENIAQGNGLASLKFLHELYLILENKTANILTSQSNQNEDTTFTFEKMTDSECNIKRKINPPIELLLKKNDLIKWYKTRHEQVKENLDEIRRNYTAHMQEQHDTYYKKKNITNNNYIQQSYKKIGDCEKFGKITEKFDRKIIDKKDYTYDELLNVLQRAKICEKSYAERKNEIDSTIQRLKFRQNVARDCRSKIETLLEQELWQNSMNKYEEEFDKLIAKKILKQSKHEKQMVTKYLEVRNYTKIVVENRQYVENLIAKKRKTEFNKIFLDCKDINKELKNYNFEKERMTELYKRLYKRKLCNRIARNYNLCKDIVNAFIDMAVLISIYKKQHQLVPKTIRKNWVVLFLANKSLYNLIENVENRSNQTPSPLEKMTSSEYERQKILNENDINEYLNYLEQWQLLSSVNEELMSKIDITNNMEILSYIVHRLLLAKYPKPPDPIPPELPKFKIAVCAIGINDYKLMSVLTGLLEQKNIILFEVQNAINYCLRIFKNQSIGIEDVESRFFDETLFVVNPEKIPAPIQMIKVRKDDTIVITPSEFKTKQIAQNKSVIEEVEPIECNETKTPNYLPEKDVKESLIPVVQLGKCAYESLTLGKPLNDYTIANMIVAYLQTLSKYDGWVLLNYPKTLRKANILETTMTCKNTGIKITVSDEDESLDDISNNYQSSFFENNLISCDENKDKRKSKLIKCLDESKCNEEYKSFLSAFIIVKEQICLCDTVENITSLEKFYTHQGLCHIFYYNAFNSVEIEQLVHLIMSSNKLQLSKTSGELNREKMESAIFTDNQEWPYVNIAIHSAILYGLATIWNNMELTYLDDLEELMFIKRTHSDIIVSYMTYVRNHMKEFISQPDEKQDLVRNFQCMYNAIIDDIRDDEDVCCELHCRVEELRDKLCSVCDKRMNDAEEERKRIIKENWIFDQLVFLTNIFLSLFEIEIDRCCDTLQIIKDYYLASLGIQLNPEDRLEKPKLELLDIIKKANPVTDELFQQESLPQFPKVYNDIGQRWCEMIAQILSEKDKKSINDTPLVEFINKAYSTIKLFGSNWEAKMLKILKEQQNSKKKLNQAITSDIRKLLFDEWLVTINSEIKRFYLRLDVIKTKAMKDQNEILESVQNIFLNIYQQISDQYNREINNVQNVCKVLGLAIENRTKIQQELILENDTFLVFSDRLMFCNNFSTISSETNIYEQISDDQFSITQLIKLYYIFNNIAPSGTIPERIITFILQDIFANGGDDGFYDNIPISWKLIEPSKLSNVFTDIFRDNEFVDWRDFIIYNMNIPFPTEKQIFQMFLNYRFYDPEKTEFINKSYYDNVPLWFEEQNTLTCKSKEDILSIKELLFKMFVAKSNMVNYRSLLLAFCKDQNPIIGIVKAFSLVLESLIGWNPDDGELQRQKDIELFTLNICVCDTVTFQDVKENSVNKEFPKKITYLLSFNDTLMMLSLTLPCHLRNNPYALKSLYDLLKKIFEDLRENHTNERIYAFRFLQHPLIIQIIEACYKFHYLYPPVIIKKYLIGSK